VARGATEKTIAVADASFLIGISVVRQWETLRALVDKLYVTPTVWQEVVLQGQGRPGAQEVKQIDFIEQRSVQKTAMLQMLSAFLDPGEAETLALAQETGCSVVFIDELRGRKAATAAGLLPMGIVGFLIAAKQNGLIQEVRPLLETLLRHGFRLSTKVIDTALQQAGEKLEPNVE